MARVHDIGLEAVEDESGKAVKGQSVKGHECHVVWTVVMGSHGGFKQRT